MYAYTQRRMFRICCVYWKWRDHTNTSNSNLTPLYYFTMGPDTSIRTITSSVISPPAHCIGTGDTYSGLSHPEPDTEPCLAPPKCLRTGLLRKGRKATGRRRSMCTLSRLTLCDPRLLCHRIFQAKTLEWVAISYSRDLPDPGVEPTSPGSPALAGGFFTTVLPGKPQKERQMLI